MDAFPSVSGMSDFLAAEFQQTLPVIHVRRCLRFEAPKAKMTDDSLVEAAVQFVVTSDVRVCIGTCRAHGFLVSLVSNTCKSLRHVLKEILPDIRGSS